MKTEARLFRSTGLVSLGTLSSRLLGLVREMMMAWVFGTSTIGSAFTVAFTIPNLFRRLFGEGALSAAFIPSYIRCKSEQGEQAGWQLARNVLSLLILILGGISFLGMCICSLLLRFMPLSETTVDVLTSLRILLPYMIWICLAAITMGILNAHRRYMVPAFAPCLLNLLWILTLWTIQFFPDLPDERKVEAICWSILLAGVLQFGVQLPAVRRLGYRRPEQVDPFAPEVKSILRLMGPAALGAAIVQVNVVIDRVLAIWVAGYGPLALSYSERLIYLPLGLFATALGTVLLPELSYMAGGQNPEKLGDTLNRSLRGLMFIMIPASVGLAALAEPIIRTVYERGSFDSLSTLHTSRALLCYAPGLVVFSAAKIFIPLFYAHKDTRTPVKIGAYTVLANLMLNLLFIRILPEGWKHAGLALGTSISSLLQVAALAWISRRRYADPHWAAIAVSWGRQLICCVPMVFAARKILQVTAGIPLPLSLLAAIGAAMISYAVSARLLRAPELRELLKK